MARLPQPALGLTKEELDAMFIAKSKQLIDQVFTWDDFVNNFG